MSLRLGNDALDDVRRRVQNDTLRHRGHKDDPLYRARKLLVSASERITDNGRIRLRGLLDASDPKGEVRLAWHAKETLRSIYDINDPELGADTVKQLAVDLQDLSLAPEINRLGRTLSRWHTQISNWHTARVTNAATEAGQQLDQTRQTRRLRISPTSPTTASAHCSTPEGPTGRCSTPSLPPEIRRTTFTQKHLRSSSCATRTGTTLRR